MECSLLPTKLFRLNLSTQSSPADGVDGAEILPPISLLFHGVRGASVGHPSNLLCLILTYVQIA